MRLAIFDMRKAVKATNYEVAVLPWAATEAHNYHLPYATDIIEGEAIAAEAGRIAWEAGTQLAILRDLVTVLDRQGIKKLVVFNSHGGNNFRTMLRELGVEFPEMLLVETNWFKTFDRYEYVEEGGDHACELETSLVLHLRPDLVLPLDQADDGAERQPRIKAFKEGWVWRDFFADVTAKFGQLFVDLAAVDKDDFYE